MDSKIVIIGLDGVPFDMIKGFVDDGIMPNTANLISSGVFRKTSSTIPDISSVAWSSMITGKNPGEHGIFGFTDLHPASYKLRFPNYTDLKVKPFWDDWNGKSVIINVPSTYPVRPMNGIHVSGFVSIDINKSVYPSEVVSQLEDIDYRLDVDSRKAHVSSLSFLEDLSQTLDARVAAYRYLWHDSVDWSTFMLVFTGTDRLMHFLWNAYEDQEHQYHSAFSLHFGRIDKIIGEILSKLKSRDLVVMLSDHGFEGLYRDVYINRLLCEAGFLAFDGESQLANIARSTKAFALDPARIYINYAGKYPNGSVRHKDTKAVLKELRHFFSELRYGGRKVINRVYLKEEIFCGEFMDSAPDMVLIGNNGFNLKGMPGSDKSFDKGIFTGKHTQDTAFAIFNGLKNPDAVMESVSVQDIRGIIEADRKMRHRGNNHNRKKIQV